MPEIISPTDQVRNGHLWYWSFSDLLKILLRSKWYITTVVIVFMALTIFHILTSAPQYTAVSQLLVESRVTKIANVDEVLSAAAKDQYALDSRVEIIRSVPIAEKVIKQLNLKIIDEEKKDFLSSLKEFVSWGDFANTQKKNESVTPNIRSLTGPELLGGLEIQRKGQTFIIEVKYTHSDPVEAAQISNAFSQAFLSYERGLKYNATRNATLWLQERVSVLKQEVQKAHEQVYNFRSSYNLASTPDGGLSERELAGMMQNLVSQKSRVSKIRRKLDRLRQLSNDPKSVINYEYGDFGELNRSLRSKYSQQQKNYASLAEDDSVSLIEKNQLKAELSQTLDQLGAALRREINRSESELKIAVRDLNNLQNKIDQRQKQVIELRTLIMDADATQSLYQSLLRRLKETRAQETLATADAKLVSEAEIPIRSNLRKKFVLVAALSTSLMFGIGIALAREFFNQKVRDEKDLEKSFGKTPVATFENIRMNKLSFAEASVEFLDQQEEMVLNLRKQVDLVADNQNSKIFAVFSSMPFEGRSLLAYTLAHYQSLSGKYVALVDFDFNKHMLTDLVVSKSENELDSGNELQSIDLQNPVKINSNDRFNFFPCPRDLSPEQRRNFLMGGVIGEFLEDLQANYDLVLIDTSPINSSIEPLLIAEYVEKPLFVVEANSVKLEEVNNSLHKLRAVSESSVDLILNKVR